jgi:hypothetical protein
MNSGIDYSKMAKVQAVSKELIDKHNNEVMHFTKCMVEIEFEKKTGLRREITAIKRYAEGNFNGALHTQKK